MGKNFIQADREQALLMPHSLRDWIPEDHLAWFVLETVERAGPNACPPGIVAAALALPGSQPW